MERLEDYELGRVSDTLSPRAQEALPFLRSAPRAGEFSSTWISDAAILMDVLPRRHLVAFASKHYVGFFLPGPVPTSSGYTTEIVPGAMRSPFAEKEHILDIKWLTENTVLTLCSSGFLRIFNELKEPVFHQKFHHGTPLRLYTLDWAFVPLGEDVHDSELCGELWILYEDGVVIIIEQKELVAMSTKDLSVHPDAFILTFRKFALNQQRHITALVCCGATKPTLFQSHARLGSQTVLSVGSNPPLAFFEVGTENGTIHLGQIATVVASKVATVAYSAVTSFAKNWGWPSRSMTSEEINQRREEEQKVIESRLAAGMNPSTSLNDDRRRVLSCCLDPTGRLAATTDNFGRVLLVDTTLKVIVRIWKGYRNAQCAWVQSVESWEGQKDGASRPLSPSKRKKRASPTAQPLSYGLYLVIYSPVRGIIEVWRTRNGPRVVSIPVGNNARIFTVYSPPTSVVFDRDSTQSEDHDHDRVGSENGGSPGYPDTSQAGVVYPNPYRAKCLVLSSTLSSAESAPSATTVRLSEVDLSNGSLSTVYSYFQQNYNQEESFVLHQIVNTLRSWLPSTPKKPRTSPRTSSNTVSKHEEPVAVPLDEKAEWLQLVASLGNLDVIRRFVSEWAELPTEVLPCELHLEVFRVLKELVRKQLGQKTSHKACRKLLWEIQWRERILSTYEGLEVELGGVMSAYSADEEIISSFSLSAETHESYGDLKHWIELVERCGVEVSTKYARMTNCADFVRAFNIPSEALDGINERDSVSDPDSPAFFSSVFSAAKTSVLKQPFMRHKGEQYRKFVGTLFAPLLEDVFAVKRVMDLHSLVLLPPQGSASTLSTSLFLDWFFHLPLVLVLRMPLSMASSPLQRWVRHVLQSCLKIHERSDDDDYVTDEDDATDDYAFGVNDGDDMRRFPSISGFGRELFEACMNTKKLLHAYLLAEHCRVAEKHICEEKESETLGKLSARGAGRRWEILQQCLLKTLYFAIQFRRFEQISVSMLESVDIIYRLLAVAMLNERQKPSTGRHNHRLDSQRSSSSKVKYSTQDLLMDCRAILDSSSMPGAPCVSGCVFRSFPQFNDSIMHQTFRVLILIESWHRDRSKMHFLEGAISTTQNLGSVSGQGVPVGTLRAALALHVWEEYLAVHALQLKEFWEAEVRLDQSGSKRPNSRMIEAAIARRLFSAMKTVLKILLEAVPGYEAKTSLESTTRTAACDKSVSLHQLVCSGTESHSRLDMDACERKHSSEGGDDVKYTEEDYDDEDEESDRATHLVAQFEAWPSGRSKFTTELVASFRRRVATLSASRIRDHLRLVVVLDSYVYIQPSPPRVSPSRLFILGNELCSKVAMNMNPAAPVCTEISEEVISHQYELDMKLGMDVAALFELNLEQLRQEHVLFLYESGNDLKAEELMVKIKDLSAIGSELAAVARQRLALNLRSMRTNPAHASLLSTLPADTCAWIQSSQPPFSAEELSKSAIRRRQAPQKDDAHAPSVLSTCSLIQRCVLLFSSRASSSSPEYSFLVRMSQVAKSLLHSQPFSGSSLPLASFSDESDRNSGTRDPRSSTVPKHRQ